MKKRILLSLVSFFMMTAMWASVVDAYQIYVTAAANGKTGATATLKLNMKNRNGVDTWKCVLVLPAGVTYESAVVSGNRYPEGFSPALTVTTNADGSLTFFCEGEEGFTMTGTDGEVAEVTVKVAADAPVGDCVVNVSESHILASGDMHDRTKDNEFTWTIEQGEEPGIWGDLNDDQKVDIADAVTVLNIMATGVYDVKADLNGDNKNDIADFVTVLNIMAQ